MKCCVAVLPALASQQGQLMQPYALDWMAEQVVTFGRGQSTDLPEGMPTKRGMLIFWMIDCKKDGD